MVGSISSCISHSSSVSILSTAGHTFWTAPLQIQNLQDSPPRCLVLVQWQMTREQVIYQLLHCFVYCTLVNDLWEIFKFIWNFCFVFLITCRFSRSATSTVVSFSPISSPHHKSHTPSSSQHSIERVCLLASEVVHLMCLVPLFFDLLDTDPGKEGIQ